MTSKKAPVLLSALALVIVGSMLPNSASANVGRTEAPKASTSSEPVQPLLLADVVVNGAQQPAPAPAPAAVAVPTPVATAPVVEPAPRHTTVIEHEPRNYMSTIALSALMGGVAGVLIGGAIYYLADNQNHANRILYWGAGGVLVGTGVGVLQVATEENRLDRVTSTDPAPTYRLALYRLSF